jgi:hypothetical protein
MEYEEVKMFSAGLAIIMVDHVIHVLPRDGMFLFRFKSDKMHGFGMLLTWSDATIVSQDNAAQIILLSQFVEYDIQNVLF